MAQPELLYTVLPATAKTGISVILFVTDNIDKARLEAAKLTLSEGLQYVVLTSTHYTDIAQSTDSYLTEIVKPME